MSNTPQQNRIHRETLALYVPEIYACATTGIGQAWLAAYDARDRCWGQPIPCRLSVVDRPNESKILFAPTPAWRVKKHIHPPLRIGVILGDPANTPIHYMTWVDEATYEQYKPGPKDTLHATGTAITVSTNPNPPKVEWI